MAGFLDVLLRGAILVLTSLVLGGVVWARLVLRARPGTTPAAPVALALRMVGAAAALAALAQLATLGVALGELGPGHGWPVATFLTTTFARTALVRVALAGSIAVLALRLSGRAAGPGAWRALLACALALVGASAVLSHAVARVEDRALLLLLDAAHQVAAAVWIGGLAHLTLYAWLRSRRTPRSVGARAAHAGGTLEALTDEIDRPEPHHEMPEAAVLRRFSSLAFTAVVVLVAAGVLLTWSYVGEWSALVGTAYGVMVSSKALVLAVILALAALNFRAVRRAAAGGQTRLLRLAEVELGLGITVLFAAASLTSLPPAIDVTTDRATVREVLARFAPAPPRLSSPPVAELIEKAEPLMAPVTRREPIERAWSEYNHHWAGFFVLLMGVLSGLERLGVRAARHWPLAFLGLAVFLFLRNDPRAWPLGPAGFWESLLLPDVLQHRTFVVIILAFGVFEWMVRTGRLPERPWGYVFPLLCAAGGGLLLTHSHAMFNLKDEFLTEVTHTPLGLLGAFAGWGRWLELRLPGAGRGPGWLWTACLIAVGLILVVYREG
jgi:putative copper resistance protein D